MVDRPNQTTIRFSGSVTFSQVEDAYDRLRDALFGQPSVVVDCDQLAETDLGFVQTLIAARVSARRRDVAFSLKQPLAEPLLDVLRRGGFLNDPQHADFWTGGV